MKMEKGQHVPAHETQEILMEQDHLPLPLSGPMRWTYAGAWDDMVASFPWPKIQISKLSLDVQLAYSVVSGTPMLMNDGYLLLNPACFESLGNDTSPLRVLINQGYVRVLSRNSTRSLQEVAKAGADQGIQTYRELLSDKKRWTATQRVLAPVEDDIRNGPGFVRWPTVDLSSSYLRLMLSLANLPPKQRGLNVPDRVFQGVVERFNSDLTKDPSRPRSQWQGIVEKRVGSRSQVQALMQMANEVYHHNFGIALSANPPAELPAGSEIAVQSRISEPFLHLYKSYTPDLSTLASAPLQVGLLGGVDYSNGMLLVPLFNTQQKVGKSRADYLKLRPRYLEGHVRADEMADATKVYQQQLNQYLTPFIREETLPTHLTNAAVASGVVLLSVAGIGTAAVPTIVIGTVAYFASEFGVPMLMEKWRLPDKFKISRHSQKLKTPAWQEASASRQALTALTVDSGEARKLVPPSPALE
jgi:hypothetical protein